MAISHWRNSDSLRLRLLLEAKGTKERISNSYLRDTASKKFRKINTMTNTNWTNITISTRRCNEAREIKLEEKLPKFNK